MLICYELLQNAYESALRLAASPTAIVNSVHKFFVGIWHAIALVFLCFPHWIGFASPGKSVPAPHSNIRRKVKATRFDADAATAEPSQGSAGASADCTQRRATCGGFAERAESSQGNGNVVQLVLHQKSAGL